MADKPRYSFLNVDGMLRDGYAVTEVGMNVDPVVLCVRAMQHLRLYLRDNPSVALTENFDHLVCAQSDLQELCWVLCWVLAKPHSTEGV